MSKAKAYKELSKPERGRNDFLYKAGAGVGIGSGILTGASELGYSVGANTPDIPGPNLALPAGLFAAGQTARTINDFKNDPEWFKETPLLFRLPRYIQRGMSTTMPYLALGFLAFADPEIAEKAAIGSTVGYLGSETILGKFADWVESKYIDKHPEIEADISERRLREANLKIVSENQ